MRSLKEPEDGLSGRTELDTSGVEVDPLGGSVATRSGLDSVLGAIRRTREFSRLVLVSDRLRLSAGPELTASDDPGDAEPIWLPMLLVASEPMLPLRAEGSDRWIIDLRLSELPTAPDGLPLAEGIEYDRRDELRLNDLSRLGDGLDRTEGAGSLERTDGADRLIDVSGRLNELLGTRLGLTDRLGLGVTDLDGAGLRLIVLLLGELGLGAGLNDRDGLAVWRVTEDGREDIRCTGDALDAGLLELGRDAWLPARSRLRDWPYASGPASSVAATSTAMNGAPPTRSFALPNQLARCLCFSFTAHIEILLSPGGGISGEPHLPIRPTAGIRRVQPDRVKWRHKLEAHLLTLLFSRSWGLSHGSKQSKPPVSPSRPSTHKPACHSSSEYLFIDERHDEPLQSQKKDDFIATATRKARNRGRRGPAHMSGTVSG